MKHCYQEKKFHNASLAIIATANKIIAEYQRDGFDLTLRQLYYQFVAKDLIANNVKEYKSLGSLINDARLAGLVDWDAIVDRTRNLAGNTHWSSPSHRLRAAVEGYQIDKWEDQEYRLEVWIEKEALAGVIERICCELDIDFFSCRGYTSQSEMHVAGERLSGYIADGQKPVIIHLGDHDPSGKDMTRDIDDRLDMFCGKDEVKIERIALNIDQVKALKLPPNPAKLTDSRAKDYIRQFGKSSWELDALDPKKITAMISKTVAKYRDNGKFDDRIALEQEHIAVLEYSYKRLEKKHL